MIESLYITTIISSILAIIMSLLAMSVTGQRIKLGRQEGSLGKFPIGNANDEALTRRIRAFGNFIEYIPMCIIMLGLLEGHGGGAIFIWTLGILLILGRVLYSGYMLYNPHILFPRVIAMCTTYACLLVPAIWLLLK